MNGPKLTLGGVWVWLSLESTNARQHWRARALDTIDQTVWRSLPCDLRADALTYLCERYPQANDVLGGEA